MYIKGYVFNNLKMSHIYHGLLIAIQYLW